MSNGQGWETYSKLVIQQLETLNTGIESMRKELQDVKEQITKIKAKEDRLEELKAWKDKIDDVASPTQMKYAFRELEDLRTFKTKAVTIFMVVQFAMAVAVVVSRFI
jgi:DNA repair exonuclease SbcCD ATPase subunit|tara:strand:+ start:71 stop:391 length:321 start_codon:yes stop_codon:yes gene_type:complete